MVSVTAGCADLRQLAGQRTGQSPSTDPEASFEAQLSGPETDRHLFAKEDIATVGEVQEGRTTYILPTTLREDATTTVGEMFRTVGVVDDPDAFKIVLFYHGEEANRFGIAPDLAQKIAEGEWDGEFVLSFENRVQAVELKELLT